MDIKQSKIKRLEFIEARLFWEGKISRSDLIDYFQISTPQATNDIKFYNDEFPDSIIYDSSTKEHRPGEKFQLRFSNPTSDDYLKQLLVHSVEKDKSFYYGQSPTFENFHNLSPSINVEILKKISRAINYKNTIKIEYHSMKVTGGISNRWISPHALVFDGFRLHIRAYCFKRNAFIDFNLGRILNIENTSIKSIVNFDLDYEWTNSLPIIIKPHPEFVDHQRVCIEMEYGMDDGQLIYNIRAASIHYFYRRYGFDIDEYPNTNVIDSIKQQLVLLNKEEIDLKIKMLEEMSRAKLKEENYQIDFQDSDELLVAENKGEYSKK